VHACRSETALDCTMWEAGWESFPALPALHAAFSSTATYFTVNGIVQLMTADSATILFGAVTSPFENHVWAAPCCHRMASVESNSMQVRARKLPFEISTSWWKGLGQFRPAAHQGPSGAGKCLLAGELVEAPPVSGPKFRSASRRPFQSFHNFRPPALKSRPVDELASPDAGPKCYII
jgi:hypothetical protein